MLFHGYDKEQKAFGSLLGISYYLKKVDFEQYECECTFENLVEELHPYDFAVNHRGCLVNLRHIEKIQGFHIYLDNGKELSLAQKRSSDFREEMNKFLQKTQRRE